MIDILKEFFGWTCNREPEGWLSWQHLLIVTIYVGIAVALAVIIGKKQRNKSEQEKLKVLKIAGFIMIGLELSKIIIISFRSHDVFTFLGMLPLFLCSIQLITIPLASFSKGRVQQAALDFIFIFGLLSCLAGTYLASNYYSGWPVLSFDPMNSGLTHSISGFACVYVAVSGLIKMERRNNWISALILVGVMVLALIADLLLADTNYESNYFFLIRSAGTPFEIVNTIVGGVQVLYTLAIAVLHLLYLVLFLVVYYTIQRFKNKKVK